MPKKIECMWEGKKKYKTAHKRSSNKREEICNISQQFALSLNAQNATASVRWWTLMVGFESKITANCNLEFLLSLASSTTLITFSLSYADELMLSCLTQYFNEKALNLFLMCLNSMSNYRNFSSTLIFLISAVEEIWIWIENCCIYIAWHKSMWPEDNLSIFCACHVVRDWVVRSWNGIEFATISTSTSIRLRTFAIRNIFSYFIDVDWNHTVALAFIA